MFAPKRAYKEMSNPMLLILIIISMSALSGALLVRQWVIAILLYMFTGFLFVYSDRQIPVVNRPSYVSNQFYRYLMVLFWPLRLFAIVQEYLYYRNHPGRFLVYGYGPPDMHEKQEFKTFKEAVIFAQEKAKPRHIKYVALFDAATNRFYDVYSSGKAKLSK